MELLSEDKHYLAILRKTVFGVFVFSPIEKI